MPQTGTWRISFSIYSRVDTGEANLAYLYHNGQKMAETVHATTSGKGEVDSTGGREILMRAEQGDSLTLRTGGLDHAFYRIMTCFEFNIA